MPSQTEEQKQLSDVVPDSSSSKPKDQIQPPHAEPNKGI